MTAHTATAHAYVLVNGIGIHVDVTASTAGEAVAQITGIPGAAAAHYDDNGRLVAANVPAAPAPEGNASPAPEAPAATTSAPQTSSEPATAPATDATPSATQTPEPSSPAPATAEVSGEDVLAAAKKLLTSGPEGEPKLKEALAAVGATTVGTCPAEKRADLLAAINEKLGA